MSTNRVFALITHKLFSCLNPLNAFFNSFNLEFADLRNLGNSYYRRNHSIKWIAVLKLFLNYILFSLLLSVHVKLSFKIIINA